MKKHKQLLKSRLCKAFGIIVFVCLSNVVFAQPGSIDTTFNPTDLGFGYGDGANGTIFATVIQSDGKIIIGGGFTAYNGTACNRVARLNTDGSLDATFIVGTGADGAVWTTAIQSDGKIIIGGGFSTYNGTACNRIARLNTDGSLDASFNVGTGANDRIYTTAVQSDGKIYIGGWFTSYNGTACNRIARLNTDGSLDASFNVGTGANDRIYTTAVQSDGKINIGGWFTSYNGTACNRVARLNTDGSLDATFIVGTGADGAVWTTAIQSDGKIIIGGGFSSYNGSAINRIARLNTDGSLDATFNVGSGANNYVYATVMQSDEKIIIGGYFTSYNGAAINRITRLNTNGSRDTTFIQGTGTNNTLWVTAIQSDGKIIIGGGFSSYNGTTKGGIVRLNSNGSIDASYNAGTGVNGIVYTTAIQSDGKIIIGGNFTTCNGTIINRIARLNPDGRSDTTFNVGAGANHYVSATAIQNDGKIIIGGWFTSYNGTAGNYLARLNTDGSLDATFVVGTGTNGHVYTTAVQSDGRIVIGGGFNSYNGTTRNGIARLNTDGSVDTTFNVGSGTNNNVYAIAIQSNSKIIIVGGFTSYNGAVNNCIVRLNTDGSIDTTFNVGSGANYPVRSTAIQSDGKIIIGGDFTSYIGTTMNRIARLNTDGTIDNSFNPGIGASYSVQTISLQSDGKIIIGGLFTSYNDTTTNFITRLNTDGSIDPTFNMGVGANDIVCTTALQSDGKIFIGGAFTSYNGTGRNRVARILGDTVVSIGSITANNETLLYPNPSGDYVTIVTAENSSIEIVSIHGQTVKSLISADSKTIVDLSELTKGIYIIRIRTDKEIVVKKLIKQ